MAFVNGKVPAGCYYAIRAWEGQEWKYYSAGATAPEPKGGSFATDSFVLVDFTNGYIYTSAPYIILNMKNNNTFVVTDDEYEVMNEYVSIIACEHSCEREHITLEGVPFSFGDGSGLLDKNKFLPSSFTKYWGDFAFYERSDITHAVFPQGISSANSMYGYCSSLKTSDDFPNGVTSIDGCFIGCALTTPPTIPSSVTNISWCFRGCSSLTTPPTIPSSVTRIDGCFAKCALTTPPTIPSSVTNISYCFDGCSSLTTPPTIPSSVTTMSWCFRDCTSLTAAPTIPSSVTRIDGCFARCAFTTPPTIPSSVTNMASCFRGCSSLTTPPTIPSSVANMSWCFYDCTSLTTAPVIPSYVQSMTNCFANCAALSGNIIVNTDIISLAVFSGTVYDIYIINGAGTSAVETAWKYLASQYANVHYEADDNPDPVLSYSVTRVAASDVETPSENGEYAFINANAITYDTFIPDGWSVVYDEDESITKDGITESPHWTRTLGSNNIWTLKCWIPLGDASKHIFTLQVSDSIEDENDNVKVTQLSSTITQILSKVYKLVDYYHDPLTDTEGMSIGKFATDANLFDVEMPTLFRDTVSVKDGNAMIRLLFDYIYPVGSYYETSKSQAEFDPNDVWGGTWLLETEGLVHVSGGENTNYEINHADDINGSCVGVKDDGEETHALTAGETGIKNHVHAMGAHTHNSTSGYYLLFLSTSGNNAVNRRSIKPGTSTALTNNYYGANAIERGSVIGGMSSATNTGNPTVGEQSGSAHNNMQPYIIVNRWHRIA